MGYQTEFAGQIDIQPVLNVFEMNYLRRFADSRRMTRENGPYFVDGLGMAGQGDGPDKVLNHNMPPQGQPGLWCKWEPNSVGSALEWNGAEKFYDGAEWMKYLIDHFLKPDAEAKRVLEVKPTEHQARDFEHFTFDHILNGEIKAEGEESGDIWKLIVVENKVMTAKAAFAWADPEPV